MLPVEFMGMLIKPSALAIRLFANMVAGHTLMAMLALFGKMAFGGLGLGGLVGISAISIVSALAIGFLELFVAFYRRSYSCSSPRCSSARCHTTTRITTRNTKKA